jgi:TPR repeat protein
MTRPDSKLPEDNLQDVESMTNADRLRVALEIGIAALILVAIYYLFAPEKEIDLAPPLQESQIDPIIRDQLDSSTQQSAPLEQETDSPKVVISTEIPTPKEGSDETESALPVIEGGSARELIKRLRAGELAFDSKQILEQVSDHQNQGRLTDAYLLLFYAAREGDAQAAFSLASMHDPNHFSEGNPLLEKPDSYQAHKWYSAAADKGVSQATERLRILRKTTEERANSGDSAAMRLLLNWQ